MKSSYKQSNGIISIISNYRMFPFCFKSKHTLQTRPLKRNCNRKKRKYVPSKTSLKKNFKNPKNCKQVKPVSCRALSMIVAYHFTTVRRIHQIITRKQIQRLCNLHRDLPLFQLSMTVVECTQGFLSKNTCKQTPTRKII